MQTKTWEESYTDPDSNVTLTVHITATFPDELDVDDTAQYAAERAIDLILDEGINEVF